MCGRYTLAADEQALVEVFDIAPLTFELGPRYNIAPSQDAMVVAEDTKGRRGGLLRWGLVPPWQEEPGAGFINARAETVATKPSFQESFERRRCLVPSDGFYEWKREGARSKTPFWIHAAGGDVLAFAGLWASWSRPGHEPRHTFTILTTDANDDIAPIHHRMPVLVPPEGFATWLDRGAALGEVRDLLRPAPTGVLTWHAVSPRVNRPAEDDAMLIAPA